MESFSRVFPLDWTMVQTVSAVAGVLIVILVLLAFIRRGALRRQEERSRAVADQLASSIAGEMMARSQQNGDRFSLKEGSSIATLVAEAVLALDSEDTRPSRRAVRQLKAANSGPATAMFADMARRKLDEAEHASRQAATALRHQGALTLPHDTGQALGLFQQALELDPANAENLLAVALVQFRLGDIAERRGLDRAGARRRGGEQRQRSHGRPPGHVRRRAPSQARSH